MHCTLSLLCPRVYSSPLLSSLSPPSLSSIFLLLLFNCTFKQIRFFLSRFRFSEYRILVHRGMRGHGEGIPSTEGVKSNKIFFANQSINAIFQFQRNFHFLTNRERGTFHTLPFPLTLAPPAITLSMHPRDVASSSLAACGRSLRDCRK
jgi:hypothetical protein